ncbi:hypothetical protein NEOLEDRAFT_1239185 [Neolentinus lepideus HHB14362 ss-1]|uniref:4a-hydroxytetrahydrobiopterin dehydratase n=1 Tax=Neolentinus lepideus HHB14362 ss-1 TaxID=1314782 RepID=A0A165V5E2_9AGAM|nr:hypothetical protein NEOLEDRAFT_1239185 [Neolentinus lepideus HHB14362 ss-1]
MLARLSVSSRAAVRSACAGRAVRLVNGQRLLVTAAAETSEQEGRATEATDALPTKAVSPPERIIKEPIAVPAAPEEPILLDREQRRVHIVDYFKGRRWWVNWRKDPLVLSKSFPFEKYDDVIDFANVVAGIAKAENHHPVILMEPKKVQVRMFTHQGILVTPDAEKKPSRGVTMRDVRFASLVENAWLEQFVTTGRFREPRAQADRQSSQEIEKSQARVAHADSGSASE